MSEQDKRPVFMGNFERYKKEMQVKHESLVSEISDIKKGYKRIVTITAILIITTTIIAFAM